MHAEYTIRAFEAGKHVICEKPMAITVEDCDRMIAAAKKADKHLSIGYRLHFDPYHAEMIRLAHQKVYGELKKISASFSFVGAKGSWRLNKKYSGGGPLMDVGIYCLQAVCYITGQTPIAVTAQALPITDPEKFVDIEETLNFKMQMPGGITGECRTSYAENMNYLSVEAERGWFELRPAFNYSGLKGTTSDGKIIEFPKLSQQARQMDGIAMAIKNGKNSIVPGEMGKRDMEIIKGVYESMRREKIVRFGKEE